jgi:HD-GYP domain-containing protein (c-di-GMP phosphodiesterase class II)
MELLQNSPPKVAITFRDITGRNVIELAPALLKPENRDYLKGILSHEYAHVTGSGEIGATYAERGLANLRLIFNIIPLTFALLSPRPANIMNMTTEERLAFGANYTDDLTEADYSRRHVSRVARFAELIAFSLGWPHTDEDTYGCC